MSKSSKALAFKLVFAHEGGFVDHPKDPGGATNKGVTTAVYDAYRQRKGLAKRSVRSITTAEANDIYESQYWDKVDGDELPAGLDYAVYDYAVNSGPARAIKALQRQAKVGVDGVMGNQTLAAVCAMVGELGEEEAIRLYCQTRVDWMRTLNTWKTFGVGWNRRVFGSKPGVQSDGTDKGVVDFATKMALEDAEFGKPKAIPLAELPAAIGTRAPDEVSGKANETDAAVTKSKIGIGAIVAAVGGAGPAIDTAKDAISPHADKDGVLGHTALLFFMLLTFIGVAIVLTTQWEKFRERAAA